MSLLRGLQIVDLLSVGAPFSSILGISGSFETSSIGTALTSSHWMRRTFSLYILPTLVVILLSSNVWTSALRRVIPDHLRSEFSALPLTCVIIPASVSLHRRRWRRSRFRHDRQSVLLLLLTRRCYDCAAPTARVRGSLTTLMALGGDTLGEASTLLNFLLFPFFHFSFALSGQRSRGTSRSGVSCGSSRGLGLWWWLHRMVLGKFYDSGRRFFGRNN